MPTKYRGTPKEELALNTYIKLTRAASALETRLADRGAMDGLTISQFGVLEALYHLGPMCQGELSQKLLKSTGNMTLVIDNLEKRGLVRRVRSLEDRRMIKIELTHDGRDLIARVFPEHLAAIVREIGVLTAQEQADLGQLLRKLGRGSSDCLEAGQVNCSGNSVSEGKG